MNVFDIEDLGSDSNNNKKGKGAKSSKPSSSGACYFIFNATCLLVEVRFLFICWRPGEWNCSTLHELYQYYYYWLYHCVIFKTELLDGCLHY